MGVNPSSDFKVSRRCVGTVRFLPKTSHLEIRMDPKPFSEDNVIDKNVEHSTGGFS